MEATHAAYAWRLLIHASGHQALRWGELRLGPASAQPPLAKHAACNTLAEHMKSEDKEDEESMPTHQHMDDDTAIGKQRGEEECANASTQRGERSNAPSHGGERANASAHGGERANNYNLLLLLWGVPHEL